MKKVMLIIGFLSIILTGCTKKVVDESSQTNTVTDVDGNVYKTVAIGTQTWIVENLKVTKLNDGTSIPNVTANNAWSILATPGYCWYNNDMSNKNVYGGLYNWYTVSTGKLCPTGWHVPSVSEWTTLINFLGSETVAGGKMKETGLSHWITPNAGATNSSGFTALPAGIRYSNTDNFAGSLGFDANFWTSTQYTDQYNNEYTVTDISLGNDGTYVYFYHHALKKDGNSVRCCKD
ncbi:MAG: fibrobacter succinogenes major paralogous domain-containing protein [Bacteroidetes bacterium]|nr:fibrobacter succinogenes major paralogous domain-containing protein [Bacteroidota bacterium]